MDRKRREVREERRGEGIEGHFPVPRLTPAMNQCSGPPRESGKGRRLSSLFGESRSNQCDSEGNLFSRQEDKRILTDGRIILPF